MISQEEKQALAGGVMLEFAERTGLSPAGRSPDRYLWTDAFAVCNFLGLYRQTGDERYRRLALQLIDQVHSVLGRHRQDDGRKGWISGLSDEEGRGHPTKGGLRIGKKLGERRDGEPFDRDAEWDRDGQYFHYLTQWMHALDCAGRAVGEPVFDLWAAELAQAAHAKFAYRPAGGKTKGLYWKMSIDLSYPLVPSMGHHDPLDGLVTYCGIQAAAGKFKTGDIPDLSEEIAEMEEICRGRDWATDDPLGIGGLLICAYRIGRLMVEGAFPYRHLFDSVLEDSLRSLQYLGGRSPLELSARYRLAFRELGLSIGLQGIKALHDLAGKRPEIFTDKERAGIEGLIGHLQLSERINAFWIEEDNRKSATWTEHLNINMVMLATSLAPEGYLCRG